MLLVILSQALVGPHPISLANTYTSFYDRTDAVVFNPASPSLAPRLMFGAFYSNEMYYGGGFVFPNRFLSMGLFVSYDTTNTARINFALARSFGTMHLGVGAYMNYNTQADDQPTPHFYAGAAFSPIDNFVFGFSVFNIDTPDILYFKFGLSVYSVPTPLGRNLTFFADMGVNFNRNATSKELGSLGLEYNLFSSIFLRLGYNADRTLSLGLGYIYVYNTVDIHIDASLKNPQDTNRIYSVGATVKFLGYNVWVESSPKVIEVVPGAEASVTKLCMKYVLPAEVDRWILKITNRWGKVFKTYWGEGDIPDECIFWHAVDEDGNYVGKGVYYYDFYVKTVDGKIFRRKGSVVNIKEVGR